MKKKILLTGGMGYIGSHITVQLAQKGFDVVIVDNLSNSKKSVLKKLQEITKQEIAFYKIDICNKKNFEKVFQQHKIFGVIHLAGLKAVGESVALPLKYYNNNLVGSLNLLELMQKYNVKNLVFSSSATVYSANSPMPLTEESTLAQVNPYGKTKYFLEEIFKDYQNANPTINMTILRYFNPIGAHESGLIGEDPNGIPNNLVPYVCKVATGKLPYLKIFGNDYDTRDGTGVRDYIHITDLANAHVLALEMIEKKKGLNVYNIGTGNGSSVLDIVNCFNTFCPKKIEYKFCDRRDGDVGTNYSSVKKAEQELGFKSEHTLEEMCKSAYYFAKKNYK